MEDKEKNNDGLGILGWDMLLCGLIGLIGIIAEKCHDYYYDKKYNRNETKDIIIEDDTSHCVEDIQNNNTAIGTQNTYFLSVADLADGDGQDDEYQPLMKKK